MSDTFYEREFPSTLDAMRPVLQEALDRLKNRGWFEDNAFSAHLCLEEALVNAIRHGNQGDSQRNVRILLREYDDALEVRVYDEGPGFTVEEVPDPQCEQHGGRGICLIRHYMDEVKYYAAEHCLVMIMRRNETRRKPSLKE